VTLSLRLRLHSAPLPLPLILGSFTSDASVKHTIVEDYGHGEARYGWRPPPPQPRDYPPDDYDRERRYHDPDWERERSTPARDFSPRPERFRDGGWPDERERARPYPYDEPERARERERARGELRIREYRDEAPYRREEPPHPEWERPPRPPPPPLPERTYPPEYETPRPHYGDRRGEPAGGMDAMAAPQPATPGGGHPDAPCDPAAQGGSAAGVLALSQRQHEIILKAAQELKFIRWVTPRGPPPRRGPPGGHRAGRRPSEWPCRWWPRPARQTAHGRRGSPGRPWPRRPWRPRDWGAPEESGDGTDDDSS
jgi:hypothetical protein